LPAELYCFAEWRVRRVGVDYHIELDAHFYSVPQRFARSEVEVRLTPQTVEIFRGASGSRRIGEAAATMGMPPLPSTCRRATDVMPTGPSSAFVVPLLPSVQPSLLYAT